MLETRHAQLGRGPASAIGRVPVSNSPFLDIRLTRPRLGHTLAPGLVFGGASLAHGVAGHSGVVARSMPPAWVWTKPAESRESPFHELELAELWEGTGKTRVRQHINPLRRDFQQPAQVADWAAVFADPSLPLAVDIGSGYGRFLLLLQRNNPEKRVNYLGIEIRKTLVDRSNEWVSRLGLGGRVHYVFANATVSMESLLQSYPGPVSDAFVQFPDPHFKRRHHKRRVVQRRLVAALTEVMPSGGRLLLQSDVEGACVAMRNTFELYAADNFELGPQHDIPGAVFFSKPVPDPHAPSPPSSSSSSPPSDPTTSAISGSSPCSPSPSAHSSACSPPASLPPSSSSAMPSFPGLEEAAAAGGRGDDAPSPSPSLSSASSSAPSSLSPSSPAAAAAAPDYAAAAVNAARRAMAAAASAAAAVRQAEEQAPLATETSIDMSDSEDNFRNNAATAASHDGGSGSNGGNGDAGDADYDDVDVDNMDSVWARGGWLVSNPVGTPTEREHYVEQQGLPVYRVLLVRK